MTDTAEPGAPVEPIITPDDLDLSSAPRVRADAASVAIDGETVLLGDLGFAHVLNPTGTLVWQFLDGEVTLDELVDDFVGALDVDRSTVAADVLDFTRILGAVGMLDGVGQPIAFEEIGDDWTPPDSLAVGDTPTPFTLLDLDGNEVASDEWRGGRILLVNWSPGCGYCVQIAGHLAAAESPLADDGVGIVYLTDGDPDANRRVFDEAGIAAAALLRDDSTELFNGVGTPSAYLIDTDGRVEAPLALGAFEVPQLLAQLTGDPGAGSGRVGESKPAAAGVQYLAAPLAACGPGRGGGGAVSDEWAGTRAYAFDEIHVGVQVNIEAAGELVDRLLVGAPVDDDGVPGNYSVTLDLGAGSGVRKLNLLVQAGTHLVRSRSVSRVLAALLAYLDADLTPMDIAEGRLPVIASAGIRDGEALLLPGDLRPWLKELQPRLARSGIALVDGPVTYVDVRTQELVVPTPSISFAQTVLDEVDDGTTLRGELPWVRPGRYPLGVWYLPSTEETTGPWSPAQGVAAAYRYVVSTHPPVVVGEHLADLFGQVRAIGVWTRGPEDLADQLMPS